jgi:aldehyde dehydrogenase (NAD+)
VEVVQGGVDVSEPTGTTLGLYIFYRKCCCWKNSCTSGSKTSYPVTLELGGKNPCIIDETNLKLAAKRLFGKICKCGTDLHCSRLYLDSKDMKNKFIDYLKEEIIIAYGNEPENLLTLPELSMLKWNRLTAMIDDDKVILVVSLMNLTVTSLLLLLMNIDSLI